MSTSSYAKLFMGLPALALVVTACGPDRAGMGSDGREGWGGSAAAPRALTQDDVIERDCEGYEDAKAGLLVWRSQRPGRTIPQRDVEILEKLHAACMEDLVSAAHPDGSLPSWLQPYEPGRPGAVRKAVLARKLQSK